MKIKIHKLVVKSFQIIAFTVLVLLFHCTMRDAGISSRLNPLDPLNELPNPNLQHVSKYLSISPRWCDYSFKESTGSLQCSLVQAFEFITVDYGIKGDTLTHLEFTRDIGFEISGFRMNLPYEFKFTGYMRNGEMRTETFTDTTPAGVPPFPPAMVRGEGTQYGAAFQWDEASNSQKYIIERLAASGGNVVIIQDSTTLIDTLDDYNPYLYSIGSINQYGIARNNARIEIRKNAAISPPETCFASRGLYPDYVLLKWTNVANASSYRIYRAVSRTGVYSSIAAVFDTVYKDPFNSSGILYYRIASVDDSGHTGRMGTPVEGYFTDSIDVPDGVGATNGVLTDKIMVFWNLVKGGVSYNIYSAPDSTATFEYIATVKGNLNFYSDSSIKKIVNYYKVSAVDSNGIETRKSNFIAGTIKPRPAPDNVQATHGTNMAEVTVTWDSVSGASEYYVYRSVKKEGPFAVVSISKTRIYHDITKSDSTKYYRISCLSQGIESELSPVDSGWKMSEKAPANLSASLGSYYTHIALQWQHLQGIDTYAIFRSSDEFGPYLRISTADTNRYNDSTVPTNDYYYYRVAPIFQNNIIGKQSDFTQGFTIQVDQVSGLTATTIHPSRIYIRWKSVEQAQFYIVYKSQYFAALTPIDTISDTMYIDSLLSSIDTAAYYAITAGVLNRLGDRSPTIYGKILSSPAITAIVRQDNGIYLSWNYITNAYQYKVYRSFGNVNNFRLVDSVYDPYIVDTSTRLSGTYYYRLTACSDSGESKPGTVANVAFTIGPQTLKSSSTNDTVLLWWPKVSGVTTYSIYRSGTNDSEFTNINAIVDTFYRDLEVMYSGDYLYFVRGYVSANSYYTTMSPIVKVSVLAKPQAPTIANPTSYNEYIRVSWSPNASGTLPSAYILYRATSSSGTYTPIDTVTDTYFNDSVSSTTTFYYKVSGINAAGEGPLSSYNYGYVYTPSAPVSIAASWDNSPAWVYFYWKKNSGAVSYIVLRSTSSGGSKVVLDTVSDTSYFDSSSSQAVTYYYTVQSLTSRGLPSYFSTERSGRKLGPPASVSVSSYPNYISLSWTSSTAVDVYYKIYRSTSSSGPYTILDSTDASFYMDSVSSSGYFYYKISSINNGESLQSSTYSGRLSTPLAPVMVSASTGITAAVKVVWNRSAGAQSYKLYRSTSSSLTNSTVVGTPVDTFYLDTVPSDSFYYYKCKTVNQAGESSLSTSSVVGYRMITTVPSIPQSFSVSNNNSIYIYMYWSISSSLPSANKYKIYRSEVQGGPFQLIDSTTNSSYSDYVSRTYPDYYWYYVISQNAIGVSAPSDTLSGTRQ
jgi:fibronectin type 3 domain-containing protein